MTDASPVPPLAGVLLVHGSREHVIAWVRKGVLPVHVAPGEGEHAGWWGVVPAGRARARAPYDGSVPLLAGRDVARRLRPAIGLFTAGERAIVCVVRPGWRERTRWLAWTPGQGRHPMPGLRRATAAQIADAAGDPASAAQVEALLADPGGTAADLLTGVAQHLDLPFVEAALGTPGSSLPGSELVGPSDSAVRRFDAVVGEERRLERELEQGL